MSESSGVIIVIYSTTYQIVSPSLTTQPREAPAIYHRGQTCEFVLEINKESIILSNRTQQAYSIQQNVI